jgi:nucleotide-binding universal stress UspA family protein
MSTRRGLVVVGVDQSRASLAALEFALEEGLAHGYAVEVVTAWLWSSPYEGMEAVGTLTEGQRAAAAVQDDALQKTFATRVERPVISQTVVHESPGPALVARAEGARLLVVGSSRKGAVTRAVLGSVSEYCVRHAPAPVVVVADEKRLTHRRPGEVETANLSGAGPDR